MRCELLLLMTLELPLRVCFKLMFWGSPGLDPNAGFLSNAMSTMGRTRSDNLSELIGRNYAGPPQRTER